jgi:hypothetical protein
VSPPLYRAINQSTTLSGGGGDQCRPDQNNLPELNSGSGADSASRWTYEGFAASGVYLFQPVKPGDGGARLSGISRWASRLRCLPEVASSFRVCLVCGGSHANSIRFCPSCSVVHSFIRSFIAGTPRYRRRIRPSMEDGDDSALTRCAQSMPPGIADRVHDSLQRLITFRSRANYSA